MTKFEKMVVETDVEDNIAVKKILRVIHHDLEYFKLHNMYGDIDSVHHILGRFISTNRYGKSQNLKNFCKELIRAINL